MGEARDSLLPLCPILFCGIPGYGPSYTLSERHFDYGAEFHFSMIRKRRSFVSRSGKGFLSLEADDIVRPPFPCLAFIH